MLIVYEIIVRESLFTHTFPDFLVRTDARVSHRIVMLAEYTDKALF